MQKICIDAEDGTSGWWVFGTRCIKISELDDDMLGEVAHQEENNDYDRFLDRVERLIEPAGPGAGDGAQGQADDGDGLEPGFAAALQEASSSGRPISMPSMSA